MQDRQYGPTPLQGSTCGELGAKPANAITDFGVLFDDAIASSAISRAASDLQLVAGTPRTVPKIAAAPIEAIRSSASSLAIFMGQVHSSPTSALGHVGKAGDG